MKIIHRALIAGMLGGMLPASGQTTAPVQTPPTSPAVPSPISITTTLQLQAESVEIGDLAAYPSAITRNAGPFLLQLINLPHFQAPQLEWAMAVPTAQLAAITSAVNLKVFSLVRRQVSVVDLPAGVYLLQNASGKVFLTLTIR
jgi:hypothetical protein